MTKKSRSEQYNENICKLHSIAQRIFAPGDSRPDQAALKAAYELYRQWADDFIDSHDWHSLIVSDINRTVRLLEWFANEVCSECGTAKPYPQRDFLTLRAKTGGKDGE